jgi:hypothetical protein
MLIVGLDLATVTGVAIGDVRVNHPSQVESFSMRFRKPHEDQFIAGYNIEAWLTQTFVKPFPNYPMPDLVIAEAMMQMAGQKSDDAATVALSLHQGLWNFCYRFGIPLKRVAASTIRKHFLGVGRAKPGEDIKKMVAERCRVLGYTEFTLRDRNRTDALACWDFAAANFGKGSPAGLQLYGATNG